MNKITVTDFEKNQKPKDMVFKKNGKFIVVEFDKLFNKSSVKELNTFVLNKKKVAYCNRIDLYIVYLNYFIKYYDHDNELTLAYLHIKFMTDNKGKYSKKAFINDLYELILSDTMVEKIKLMTEDNYCVNLDVDIDGGKKYNESLQITNEHGKILMNISVVMKMMIPLLTHYAYIYNIKNMDKFILKCFDGIRYYFEGDNDIYNKLYETVTGRINETRQSDRGVWNRIEIEGEDHQSKIEDLVEKLFINIMHKYTYEGNVVHLNHAAIKKNINTIRRTKSKLNYSPISEIPDEDGLTDFDKIEINNAKFDESSVIIGSINVRQSIDKLCNKFNVVITDDELNFYIKNISAKPFQKELVFNLFAKYFGSTRDLHDVKLPDYCKLIIIMKRMLFMKGFDFMQHILSGKVVDTKSRRMTKKQINKTTSSPMYTLYEDKYKHTIDILRDGNVFNDYLSSIQNSKIQLVDYDLREYLGRDIRLDNENVINNEYLRLIDLI